MTTRHPSYPRFSPSGSERMLEMANRGGRSRTMASAAWETPCLGCRRADATTRNEGARRILHGRLASRAERRG